MTPRTRSRLEIVSAGVLWSLSGVFCKPLTETTPLVLHEPHVAPQTTAFFRALFAGLAVLPLVGSARAPRPRPLVFLMVATFAAMNLLFITAMATGTAAGAIVLQYTAPLWVLLAGVGFLGERVDRR